MLALTPREDCRAKAVEDREGGRTSLQLLSWVQRLILRQICEVCPTSYHSSQENFCDGGIAVVTCTQTGNHQIRWRTVRFRGWKCQKL